MWYFDTMNYDISVNVDNVYLNHFGLQQPPYRITPDTDLFFAGAERGEILDALLYAVISGEAITKVVGEVGSGKTMLCRMLEQKMPGNVEIVFLANPSLSPENILHAIAFELDLPVTAEDNRLKVMKVLQDYLLQRHAANRQVVVFVEEAQSMPLATLEEIRLLSNLETKHHKLLQVVLFGQPELDDGLNASHVRQIKERITNSFYLPALSRCELRDYLSFRLRLVGLRGSDIFTPAAIWLISHFSRGLMRRINIIADKAMLAAYANDCRVIGARHAIAALRDSEFLAPKSFISQSWLRPVVLVPWLAAAIAVGVLTSASSEAVLVEIKPEVTQAMTAQVKASPPVQAEVAPIQAAAAVERASLFEQRVAASQLWLPRAEAQHFTIQLMWSGADDIKPMQRFLRKDAVAPYLESIFITHAANNDQQTLNLLLGEYEGFSQAQAALEALPDGLRRFQPYLRNVRSVQAESRPSPENVLAGRLVE
jgi:MSHA biogenesis protein MshM